jgi:hypothetical protein
MMTEEEALAMGLTIKDPSDESLGLTITNDQLLDELCDYEGMTRDELIELALSDSVSPGICKRPGCGYTTEVEPDNDAGWCDMCGSTTVVSALVLAGIY